MHVYETHWELEYKMNLDRKCRSKPYESLMRSMFVSSLANLTY